MSKERVQVGVVAYRDEDGNFLPAEPLYGESDSKTTDNDSELTQTEKIMLGEFARYMTEKYFKPYMDGKRKSGI